MTVRCMIFLVHFFQMVGFWQFERELEIKFQVKLGTKPKVVAWFPNPEPYKCLQKREKENGNVIAQR